MSKTNESQTKEFNPLLFRYKPNNRFLNGAWKNQVEQPIIKDNFGDSVTDKESYRLSLASKRGAIASGLGQSGFYMFEDGKYDPNKDYSYILRKDLSIVDIDRYIETLQNKLQTSDESLKNEILTQIEAAQQYKLDKDSKEDSNIDNSSSAGE